MKTITKSEALMMSGDFIGFQKKTGPKHWRKKPLPLRDALIILIRRDWNI